MSALVWSDKPPRRTGMWWYRKGDEEPQIVRLYRADDEGELSLQYDDMSWDPNDDEASVDWVINWLRDDDDKPAQWCYIPSPREP